MDRTHSHEHRCIKLIGARHMVLEGQTRGRDSKALLLRLVVVIGGSVIFDMRNHTF